jgi:hypothetical protein
MQKDPESTFFDVLKGFGLFFSALAGLFGFAFDAIRFTGRRAMRDAEERDSIKKLGAHYDTNEVAERNAQLTRAAGFPALEGFMEGFYQRLSKEWVESNFVPAVEVRQGLIIAAGELYKAEDLHRSLPKPPSLDEIEEARYRDKLLARIRKQSNPETLPLMYRALLQSETAFSNLLPKMAHGTIYAEERWARAAGFCWTASHRVLPGSNNHPIRGPPRSRHSAGVVSLVTAERPGAKIRDCSVEVAII